MHHDERTQIVSYEETILAKEKSEEVKQTAFNCMSQLEGWCSNQKAAILIDLILSAKPETIVEIGVWGGKSLIPMACALKGNQKGKIYGIDPWSAIASIQWVENPINVDHWKRSDHEYILYGLLRKIEEFDLDDQIELIRCTSAAAPEISEIDLLHIDGNHTEPSTCHDVQKWVPLVKRGGWIVFDDMTWFENGCYTAAKAVAWLDKHCVRFAQFSDNCDWGIWYKP